MGLFNKKAEEKSPDKLINDFLTKSEGLQRILEKETEYFREMKMKQAEMLIESKINLIEELDEIKTSLTTNPTYLKAMAESQKHRIKAANSRLMAAAEDNYNETLKAKEVNKLILEAICEAVTQHSRIDGAYGEKSSSPYNDNASGPIAISENA